MNSWLTGYVRGADKYLAYLIGDGHVYELDCDGANGNRWTQADLCADFGFPVPAGGSPLTGYVRGADKYLAYLTGDGHVYELDCDGANGNRWTQADLCADFGFPPAASGSPLTGYVRGAEKYLAYLTGDGHVYELKCDGANGNRWTQADLCADFGFPAPARLQSAVLRTHTHGDDKDPDTGVYVEVHDNGKHHSLYRKR